MRLWRLDDPRLTVRALSAFRIVVSVLLLQHAAQILTGFPPHPAGTRVAPGSLIWFGGIIMLIGGGLMIAGILVRTAAFVLAGQMAVIYFGWHAPKGFYPINNGGEAPILFCAAYLLILVTTSARPTSAAP